MKTLKLTASNKPNGKQVAEYRQMMKTEGIGRLVVRVDGSDEEMVIEFEQKDAEGRTLLCD